MTDKIVIIGLGLIGSSLAIDMKAEHPEIEITGIDAKKSSEEFALKRGFIDKIGNSFDEEVQSADIIFLCTPVKVLKKQLIRLSQLVLKNEVIITDVGSTKKELVEEAAKLGLASFIGGHPMAGSHKSGVTAADGDLFENAYYILTPMNEQEQERVEALKELLKGTRAKFVVFTPEEHDKITGMLSHLPHIIAAGLVNQSKMFNQQHPRSRQLAAGGFRDITRIASSDPQMWTDILLSNQETLLQLIGSWQEEMNQVADWLKTGDKNAIYQFFQDARDTRNHLPVHKEGAIPAFYDLFVDIPDIPGVIGQVTSLLGEAELSLINLKILETREDIFGILQLTFKRKQDLQKAKDCIESQTAYRCYEK